MPYGTDIHQFGDAWQCQWGYCCDCRYLEELYDKDDTAHLSHRLPQCRSLTDGGLSKLAILSEHFHQLRNLAHKGGEPQQFQLLR